MKSLKAKIMLIIILGIPSITFAAPPQGVQELGVDYRNGKIIVSWDKLKQDDIASYRVYYSRETILGNKGAFDDFEETDGPKSSYVFNSSPLGSSKVYFSVLAVNTAGEESSTFIEEVSLTPPGGAPALPILPDAPPIDGVQNQPANTPLVPPRTDQRVSTDNVQVAPPPLVPVQNQEPNFIVPEQQPTTVPTSASQQNIPSYQEPPIIPPGPAPVPTTTTTSQPTAQPEAQAVPDDGKIHLLSAEAVSPTSVQLIFNAYIEVDPTQAPKAFEIVDASGKKLQLKKLTIKADDVRLETETQIKGKVYEVRLSEPLKGFSNNEPLDETDRKAFFTGHNNGDEPKPTVQMPEPTKEGEDSIEFPADITNVQMRATALPNGLYIVNATWDTPEVSGGLTHFMIRQSLDRGVTFADPQIVPAPLGGLDVPGAYPGHFGLIIHTVNRFGFVSKGVFKTIELGAAPQPVAMQPTQYQPPVRQQPTYRPPVANVTNHQPGQLPQSGGTFVLLTLVFAGVIAGRKYMVLRSNI